MDDRIRELEIRVENLEGFIRMLVTERAREYTEELNKLTKKEDNNE